MAQCIVRAPVPKDDGASFVMVRNGFAGDGFVYLALMPISGTMWVRTRDAATVFDTGTAAKSALVSLAAQARMSGEEIVMLKPLDT